MTDFDITQISDTDLCEAGRRLQMAHDYIEVAGFSISNFNPRVDGGACCYVGSVKTAGGEPGAPEGLFPSHVQAALAILDEQVEPPSGAMRSMWSREFPSPRYPGRRVEFVGFETCTGDKCEQAEVALPVFRQAIREVQAELERRA